MEDLVRSMTAVFSTLNSRLWYRAQLDITNDNQNVSAVVLNSVHL